MLSRSFTATEVGADIKQLIFEEILYDLSSAWLSYLKKPVLIESETNGCSIVEEDEGGRLEDQAGHRARIETAATVAATAAPPVLLQYRVHQVISYDSSI